MVVEGEGSNNFSGCSMGMLLFFYMKIFSDRDDE